MFENMAFSLISCINITINTATFNLYLRRVTPNNVFYPTQKNKISPTLDFHGVLFYYDKHTNSLGIRFHAVSLQNV